MRLVDAGVTVRDKILLHLLDYWGQIQRSEWPAALTQDGIAGVVGISRSHVAVTLPDLIEEDMIESSLQRVEGRPRRVKVYSLTYKGGSYAGGVVQRLLVANVTALDDSGEWEIPLDGLIQVHKVHLLSALRIVDEDNQVDLRKAAGLAEPKEVPGDVQKVPEEAKEVPKKADEVPEEAQKVPGDVEEVWEVAEVTTTPAEAVTVPEALPGGPPPVATPAAGTGQARDAEGPALAATGHPAAQQWPGYGRYPQRPIYYWSPLRFGTGRRPGAPFVSSMLVLGFLSLISAVAFFGVSPSVCAALWIPLSIVGWVIAYNGFRNLWAMGPRREAWTATAMSAYMLIPVTMIAFAAFGWEVVVDLLWAGLILGVPSAVLAAGTGRSVHRRARFLLLIGPVMVIAALTMAVLDPEGTGRTAAMPLLITTVGASWSFVGWVMAREIETIEVTDLVIAGGSIGLAIAVVAGAGNLASEGNLNAVIGAAVATWVAGAAYVAAISLLPSMSHLRPDSKTAYSSLAVAGAAALMVASVFFIWGGLFSVGVLEVVIAVGMIALVAPDMKGTGTRGLLLTVLGVLIAASSVMAFSLGL
jgi:hypothetical protein